MTSDDQQFLDLLASIPQDMAAYGSRVADYVEKHANAIASDIRDAIDNSSWIPEVLRPPRQQGTHQFFSRGPPPPEGIYEKAVAFVSRNRTAIAIILAFGGTTFYLMHRSRKAHARKRRAKKLPSGAKKEIVVIACSTFHDPLTRSLAVDLERRGYVVYVTVSSTEEDSLIQQEAKPDLRPLWMDLTSTVPNPAVDLHPNLEPIRDLLTKTSPENNGKAGPGSSLYNMTLAGIVLFPGTTGYPSGPLALLPPTEVIDTVNTRLLTPMLTVQQFLPLLANHSTDPKSPSSIVIAYPSIPKSLSPPNQVPEAIVTASLSALSPSLRREVKAIGANITLHELRLGNFDLGSVSHHQRTPTQSFYNAHPNNPRTQPPTDQSSALTRMHWHSSQRAQHLRQSLGQHSSLVRGSSARELHNAVFDALAPPQVFKAFGKWEWSMSKRGGTVFVGSGARVYEWVGAVVPGGLVGWILRRRWGREEAQWGSWMQPKQDAKTPVQESESLSGSVNLGSESAMWEKV